MSPESLGGFFRSTEWQYACLYLIETRDEAVRRLASTDPNDIVQISRLQQEIGTLTTIIGDDPSVESLASICKDEVLALEAEEETDIA